MHQSFTRQLTFMGEYLVSNKNKLITHCTKNECHTSNPKRPRCDKLRLTEELTSTRSVGFCRKIGVMSSILSLLLVFVDYAVVPNKVVPGVENAYYSALTFLQAERNMQSLESGKPWSDPSERDVTPTPVATSAPSIQPVVQTVVKSSSDSPTQSSGLAPAEEFIDYPARRPTFAPHDLRSSIPSEAPSINLSEYPSPRPSRYPSQSPSVVASQQPSHDPSSIPSHNQSSLQPSMLPSNHRTDRLEPEDKEQRDIKWTLVELPISFKAILEGVREDDIDELLPRVTNIWKNFFRDELRQRFGEASFVSVDLVVMAVEERRRLRILQRNNVVAILKIAARGQVTTQFHRDEADMKKQELISFLDGTITRANLQNALTSSNANFEVSVEDEGQPSSDEEPKLWEIVLGFLILAIAMVTVIFWGVVLWRKRQKQVRKRKLSALRNTRVDIQPNGISSTSRQPSTFLAHSAGDSICSTPAKIFPFSEAPRQSTPALFPKSKVFIGRALIEKDDDDDESVYKGLGSDDSDTGSEFGRQLREAASLDRASWEEFQKQKRSLEVASNYGLSSGGEHGDLLTQDIVSFNQTGREDEDQGIEVEHGGIHPMVFPYGDEKHRANNDLARKSATNGADRYGTQDHGDFEPYGDNGDIHYAGKIPYLLNRQENIGFVSSDDPSNSSLRASPTSSSWSGGDLTDIDEPGTLSMLKEVEQLSQYVQHYEQKRESRKMRELELKQREFEIKQRVQISMSRNERGQEVHSDSGASPRSYPGMILDNISMTFESVPTTQFDSASSSKQRINTDKHSAKTPENFVPKAYNIPQRSVLPASFESFHGTTDLSEGEDEISQHLGIRPNRLVSDNNSNIAKDMDERNFTHSNADSRHHYSSQHFVKSTNPDVRAYKPSGDGNQDMTTGHRDGHHQNPQKLPSPPRNVRGKIGNIVSMFESKPRTTVAPPSPLVSALHHRRRDEP